MTESETLENPTALPEAQATPPQATGWSLSIFAWLLIALLAIIVLLALINVGIWIVQKLDVPRPAAPATLLYASNFQTAADEWDQNDGLDSAQVVGDSLHIVIGDSKGLYSSLRYEFGDFDVRANVTRLQSPDPYDQVGLLFRYHDPSNFYVLLIQGNGTYSLERHKDGQIDVISQFHALPAILTQLGTTNQLRVVGKGDHYKFYVDGQLLTLCPSGPGKAKSTWNGDACMSNNGQTATEWVDDSLANGKIGVGARANSPGVEAAFNDIVIYAP